MCGQFIRIDSTDGYSAPVSITGWRVATRQATVIFAADESIEATSLTQSSAPRSPNVLCKRQTHSLFLQNKALCTKPKTMLGWINDALEKYIIEKHNVRKWHEIKARAGCSIKDNGFLKLELYQDISTIALVDAASSILGLSTRQIYKRLGEFFVFYTIKGGYENLMLGQGSTLMEWMNNINAIHQHMQDTFPKKMTMPEFWCEPNKHGSLTLFYSSSRGSYLAPFAAGLVTEVARLQFELDIRMKQKTTQGKDGARFTR